MAGGCHPADSQRSRNSVHIALIAMSGVRAWSKEITEAGLTMPGFLERSEAIASLPSLALLTLAGMTPDPFEVSYHEVLDIHRLGELPDCDVAAIASYSAQIKDAYTLADRFRAVGVRVVLGGLHVTAVPDEAMEHADAVVVGEGELGWPDLLADLRAGRPMRRVYAPHGREFDLADAPMPRFDLLDIERYNRLTVQTQRGCPWRCEFCAASIHRVRRRQHVRQPAPRQGSPAGPGARKAALVHRERHRHRRRSRAAGVDAPVGLRGGPHRAREPERRRRRGRGAAPELEALALRRLQGGHRAHPVARHRRQRLLRAGPRR